MSLTAVMGLVIEEVNQERRQLLLDLHRAAGRAIAQRALEIRFAQRADVIDDALVLPPARLAEPGEILMEDRIELAGRLALAGEALHPDPVAHEQMIEGAVQRAEEGPVVGAVVAVGQQGGRAIEPPVHPGVVIGQHRELLFHGDLSASVLRH